MRIPRSVALPGVHPYVGMDLVSALERRAELRADHPFVVWEPFEGSPRAWTYAEFLQHVRTTASALAARGIGEGDVVLNHVDNSPAFLLTLFACAYLGAVCVDLNTRYVDDELAHAISLTGAMGMVTDPRLGLAGGTAASSLEWVVEIDPATGLAPDFEGAPDDAARAAVDPGRPLCVQLTSGTTSRPKAVLYTHANALWGGQVGADHWGLTADTVMLVYAPLFHTMALSWQLMATFWVGGTVVVQPKYSSSRFWDVAARTGCTHASVLGPTLQLFMQGDIPAHEFQSFSFGLEMPDVENIVGTRFFSAYGMTELVTQAIVSDENVPEAPGMIGRPATEYEVRIVDEDGNDVDVGGTGELLVRGIRGISVFAEYVHDPVATANAFDEHGYFKTGDRVTLHPSGAISFATRLKDMLKVSGENVAAAEIERVIAAVAGVREVGVVGVPDEKHGEVAVAFVVPADREPDRDALRAAVVATCEQQLADFKRPRTLYFIDALPRATLDKVDKGSLKQLARKQPEPT